MRCFVSVNLEEQSVVDKVSAFQKMLLDDGINIVSPVNLHYTLRFLGEIDDKIIDDVINRLDKIKYNEFNVELKGVGVFPDTRMIRVIWIGSESKQFMELSEMVNSTLKGIGKEEEKFIPHLTIARVKYLKDRKKLLNGISLNASTVFGNFKVDKFYLMKSDLMPEGPRYTMLKSFNLIHTT